MSCRYPLAANLALQPKPSTRAPSWSFPLTTSRNCRRHLLNTRNVWSNWKTWSRLPEWVMVEIMEVETRLTKRSTMIRILQGMNVQNHYKSDNNSAISTLKIRNRLDTTIFPHLSSTSSSSFSSAPLVNTIQQQQQQYATFTKAESYMKPSLLLSSSILFFLFGVIGFSFSPHPCCHWCTIGQISPPISLFPFPCYPCLSISNTI